MDPTPLLPSTPCWSYQRLVERSADPMAVLDADARCHYVSPAVGPLLGWTPADLVGRDVRELVHADDRMRVEQALAATLADPTSTQTVEVRVARADGAWCQAEAVARALCDPDDVTDPSGDGHVLVSLRDVTARVAAEQRLRENEARMAAAADASGVLAWEWDLASNQTWRRGSLLERLGYAPGEVPTGGPEYLAWWMARIHPDDQGRMDAALAPFVDGRVAELRCEYRFRRPDGTWATVAEHARRLPGDAAGRPDHAVGVLVDVSARADAMRALAESEARLRTIAEHAPIGITLNAADGAIVYSSPRMAEIAGRPVEEMLGDRWMQVIHPDDLPELAAEYDRVKSGACDRLQRTYRAVRPDGSVRWVEGQAVAVRDATGAIVGSVGTLEDVTERRDTEAQLRHAQKMEAVGLLAGGVAHDFNNLLTAVSGNAELALAELRTLAGTGASAMPESVVPLLSELLGDIASAADRAAQVTRQLLAFSRKQVLQPEATTLDALVQGALSLVRRLLGEGVALDVRRTDGLRPVVLDPGQFTQVLLNLVVNARDALRDVPEPRLTLVTSGVRVTVPDTPGTPIAAADGHTDPVVARLVDGSWLPGHAGAGPVRRPGLAPGDYEVLMVADNGHGMDEATRARVFEPFFTTKGPGEGTGLGLATAYGIVRQSRGQVYVDSAPGAGTAFLVFLRVADGAELRRVAPTPVRGLVAVDPAAEGGATGSRAERLRRPAILLVEDDAEVRRVVRRVLAAQGWELVEAADGREALALWEVRRAAGRAPGVLVTDMVLPALDGLALARRLRADAPTLPVVLMSGYAESVATARAELPAGVVWVEKPFGSAALLDAIARARAVAPEASDATR